MGGRVLVRHVVREMSAVPDDDILIEHAFAVDPLIELRVGVRTRRLVEPIVDFRAVVAQHPHIAPSERPVRLLGRDAVVGPREDIVRGAGGAVDNPPLALA